MARLQRMASVLLGLAAAVGSVNVGVGAAKADSLNYYNWDTRAQGSYSVDPTNSKDGNGSLKLSVTDPAGTGQDKVAVIFTKDGTSLGTLGQLTDVSLDAYKSSTPATGGAADFAYRLQFTNGDSLVYENAYNGSATVPTDTWRTIDITGGNFWLYDGVNHNGGSDAHPLSFYSSLDGVGIIGLQVAYGSGLGAFSGNVDNVHLAFGANSFDGGVAAPLPKTAWAGLALLGIAAVPFVRSRRRTADAA